MGVGIHGAGMIPISRYPRAPGAAAAAVPWYLSGGIAASKCLAAYQPKGAATLAASYINLANPGTYNAAPGVAPGWAAATGWTFNGLTQYLTTGLVVTAGGGVLCQFTGAGITATLLFGAFNTPAGARYGIIPNNVGGVYYESGSLLQVAPVLAAGNLGMIGQQGYRNGVSDGGAIGAGSIPTIPLFIGCWNAAGTPAAFLAVTLVAWAYYSAITAAQCLAVATAMAAL